MKLKWFIYFAFFIVEGSTLTSEVEDLYFFRCLLEDTFEPCILFSDTSPNNVTIFSYKLINMYANLSANTHYAIEHQNLTLISEENFEKLPDALLLLLPVNHLSSINKHYLLNLIIQRSRSSVVKHLVKAYMLRNRDEYFYEKLQTVDLPTRTLSWIADVISSDTFGAKEIINRPPLLFYSPPFYLLFNNTSEKLFYLSLWENSNGISKEINKAYLRFWAYATIKNSFPGPLNHWNDLFLERWGSLLTASTSDELKLLKHSSIDNLQLLFSFGFSPIQVRTIFEEFAEHLMNSRLNYFSLCNLLIDLLPNQLLPFSKMAPYIEKLKVLPSFKSLATSKQIFELLMFEKRMLNEEESPYFNNFSYILPLKTISDALKHPFPLSSLIKIQSNHFSKNQLYILSSQSKVLDFNSEYIFDCKDLVKVLPARDIIFNQTASHILLHLLSEIEADNIPQTFSVFKQLWTMIGSSNVLKKILANRDFDVLLEYIPARFTTKFVNSNLITIGDNVNSQAKLPDSFVSSLLVSLSESEPNFSLLNAKESLLFLFNGVSCDHITSLDPYDFVIFMSKFNEQRRTSKKDFPKTLQQCCIEKLFSYIEMKSSLFQRVLGDSKLSLLNEAEIDSIGGYIFSALPVGPIAKAKYSKRIIKSIGELSLSELIMAAPISRLEEFGTVLVHNDYSAGKKIDFPLFDLGNLTLFLDKKYIPKINETYFRLLLESNFIDRRICAVKSSRLAWFNYLKHVFGETNSWNYQTLATIGDLLIVVPDEEIDKIPSIAWKYTADILISNYNDIIEYSTPFKFYEVCMLQLKSHEAELFFNDLKRLVKVLVDAAQLQLNSVTTFQELEKKNKSNGTLFTFINSRKSNIKIAIPPVMNVINTEKPVTKNDTQFQVTESLNRGGVEFSDSVLIYESSPTTMLFNSSISLNLENMNEMIENIGLSSTRHHKDNSQETTLHYLAFTTEVSNNENLYYSTFNQNEINQKFTSVSEKPSDDKAVTEETSTVFNIDKKYFNPTTLLNDVTYTRLPNSTVTDGESSSLDGKIFEHNFYYFTTKDDRSDLIPSSALQNRLTTSGVKLSSKIERILYNSTSSSFRIDYNDSSTEANSLSTPNSSLALNRSQTDVYSKELITENSVGISKISSMPSNEKTQNEFKIMKELDSLLKNKNAKTEFLKLNYSSLSSKIRKNSPVIIGNVKRERLKRSIGQYSCEALKMVGKLSEILISEELVQIMSKDTLNECVDLFSEMDLSLKVKNLIWSKLELDNIFLYGKLVGAINSSNLENMNFSVSAPWTLETINLIGRYSKDPEVISHVIKSITSTRKMHYSLEILVTLGSLICNLPEISPQLIEPSDLLKASKILGRNLPCNYSCLQKISNIAVKDGAFEDPLKWNAKDVSDLGIIIAGLERIHWKKLLHSNKKPLKGISEQAFKCLPPQYIEELEVQYNINLTKKYLRGPELFEQSIHYDFFRTTNNSFTISKEFISHSVKLTSFYLGFPLQTLFIAIIIIINEY